LVILDEIGRGTSTFDGLALAWAVAEELVRRADGSIRTLFATHYHELTILEGRLAGIHNMNIAIAEARGELLFTRRLVPGPADKSYGIEVARLAGVPQSVVQRAKSILHVLDSSRSASVKQQTGAALQGLLPGIAATPRDPPDPPPQPEAVVEHPLFTTLRDLDTDNLTPLKALALITEWKLLWFQAKESPPKHNP
ncbi:MAG: DNA mismatch repair protein MutS, partial [Desulfovibrio sp.]|nr:DNA mismatch repair protein MutS [Desulfovibrio sp.]